MVRFDIFRTCSSFSQFSRWPSHACTFRRSSSLSVRMAASADRWLLTFIVLSPPKQDSDRSSTRAAAVAVERQSPTLPWHAPRVILVGQVLFHDCKTEATLTAAGF